MFDRGSAEHDRRSAGHDYSSTAYDRGTPKVRGSYAQGTSGLLHRTRRPAAESLHTDLTRTSSTCPDTYPYPYPHLYIHYYTHPNTEQPMQPHTL